MKKHANEAYSYNPETGLCTFRDGTVYTASEMIFIAKQELTDDDMDGIHLVKKTFDGELDITTIKGKRS